jgi:hypothetical protein
LIQLIDKQDNFEIIRGKVAEILSAETLNQQALALEGGELDPADFAFTVYEERNNPWSPEVLSNGPVVNVWWDGLTSEKRGSTIDRQHVTSRINVDVYVQADSEETISGHDSGDELSAKKMQRVTRLVRNILMHDQYKTLSISGVVWSRWVPSLTPFQPQMNMQPVERVNACRIALDVEHNEETVQEIEETIEGVHVEFFHEPDGLVRAHLHYGTIEDPAPEPEE